MSGARTDFAAHPAQSARSRAATLWGRVRWYLAEISGDARYQRYLERCALEGEPALDRDGYERHRSAHRDAHPQGRCC